MRGMLGQRRRRSSALEVEFEQSHHAWKVELGGERRQKLPCNADADARRTRARPCDPDAATGDDRQPTRGGASTTSATSRATSSASASAIGTAACPGCFATASPTRRAPTCQGCGGMLARSASRVVVVRAGVADRERTASVGNACFGKERDPDLVEREVGQPAGQIAARYLDESREQGRAQIGGVGVERVGETHGRHRARLRDGRTGRCPPAEGTGRPSTSVSPASASACETPTAEALLAGETTAGRSDWQHRRNAVVADDAGDLFDEGGAIGQVRAPRRWRHRPAACRWRPPARRSRSEPPTVSSAV